MSIVTPSYGSGFYSPARGGIPKYPELWRGCIGAWNPGLGPTGSRLFDQSIHGNHGTLTNMDPAADWVVRRGAGALDFDGVDDIVVSQYDIPQLGNLTACAWFITGNTESKYYRLVDRSFDTGFWLGLHNGTVIGGAICAASPFGARSATFTQGVWNFAAVTRVGNTSVAYLNGSSNGSTSYTSSASLTVSGALRSGNSLANNISDRFLGQMSDLRVYNRALSASEIRTLAIRPGIAYELAPRTKSYFAMTAPPSGTAFWRTRQSNQASTVGVIG